MSTLVRAPVSPSDALDKRARGPAHQNPAAVYLASLAQGPSRRSMASALTQIARMVQPGTDVATFPWEQLRYQHVSAIRTRLADTHAPATANRYMAALRGTLREAWRLGLIDTDTLQKALDTKGVRGARLPAGRALTSAELRKLFAALDPEDPRDARDRAVLAVLLSGGLRRAELAALELAHVDIEEGSLRVLGKGRKERAVYLPSSAVRMLLGWLDCRGDEPGALFHPFHPSGLMLDRHMSPQTVRVILQRVAKAAGVTKPFAAHDFRRTFVSNLLEQGVDIATVQQMAGHANVATTSRYDRRGEDVKKRAARDIEVPE